MRTEAALLDMDGVLLDSMIFHLREWRQLALSAGLDPINDDFARTIYETEGQDGPAMVRTLFRKYAGRDPGPDELQDLVARKEKLHLGNASRIPPLPDADRTVAFLHGSGVRLAVVTGTACRPAREVLDREFGPVFETIVSGDDLEHSKPDPEPYLEALDRLGVVRPERCLAVDNSPLGIRSAVSAGIPTWGLLVGSPLQPSDLAREGARQVFAGHAELLDALRAGIGVRQMVGAEGGAP